MGDCGVGTDSLRDSNLRRSSHEEDGGAAEKRQRKEEESENGGGGLMSQFISKIASISGGTEEGEVAVEKEKGGEINNTATLIADKNEETGGVKSDELNLDLDLMSSPRPPKMSNTNTPLDVEFYEPQEEIQIEVIDLEADDNQNSSKDGGENGGESGGAAAGSRNGGGGGAISDFVANLPHSFSETSAPESDEASILIHSVVHD